MKGNSLKSFVITVFCAWLIAVGGIIYTAIHFISKFW